MITPLTLHDVVTVRRRVQTGEDPFGEPIYEDQQVPHRAEVWPLDSSENVAAGQQVTTRFRLVLGPEAEDVTPADAVTWRGRSYEIQGSVEPLSVRGEIHHFEAVVQRVSG